MSNPDQLHFLVVDDDEDARNTVIEYLTNLGYKNLHTARDGAEAIRILETTPNINFVISDWDMPLVNGLNLLKHLRGDESKAHIPFLMATSPISDEAQKVIMAAESLVDAYIIKPFRLNLFKDKLEGLIKLTADRDKEPKVVLADDDPDARDMVAEYLRSMGFSKIEVFPDGRQALNYISSRSQQVGLIIADWEMPDINGVELLRVCKSDPKLASIPFLIITSQSSMENMKIMQAAKARVDNYLLKPFRVDVFEKRVQDVLKRAESRQKAAKLMDKAFSHFKRGEYREAEKLLERILQDDPGHNEALLALGDVYIKLGNHPAAASILKQAVDLYPYNALNYTRLASVYELQNHVDKAIKLVRAAIQSISFNADLHFHLGSLYHKKKMIPAAKSEFEKALEIKLDHQEAKLMLDMINSQKD